MNKPAWQWNIGGETFGVPADIVVTVPKHLWRDWLAEGDLPGEGWDQQYWSFYCGGFIPSRIVTAEDTEEPAGLVPRDGVGDETPGSDLVWQHRNRANTWRLAAPDQRVYVVSHGRLRGYSELFALEIYGGDGRLAAFIRRNDAQALTINEEIAGFRGWRYRWWKRSDERAFPGWQTEGVT